MLATSTEVGISPNSVSEDNMPGGFVKKIKDLSEHFLTRAVIFSCFSYFVELVVESILKLEVTWF